VSCDAAFAAEEDDCEEGKREPATWQSVSSSVCVVREIVQCVIHERR
jgi:hypothetical protein